MLIRIHLDSYIFSFVYIMKGSSLDYQSSRWLKNAPITRLEDTTATRRGRGLLGLLHVYGTP